MLKNESMYMQKTKEQTCDKKQAGQFVETKDLLRELATVIAENFVAVYQMEKDGILMRILNGQQFLITVQEKK